ncbi:hypothetical protein L2E82_15429 [Cichorium intybus]|uniref:Uncharacterized protein n=1 Tax=Cichorium intybus TaxID=13427 RepID=A0ACB9F375_CICIN|nr:hypothetical protein L2E82_15429 [Cichorium intybus]
MQVTAMVQETAIASRHCPNQLIRALKAGQSNHHHHHHHPSIVASIQYCCCQVHLLQSSNNIQIPWPLSVHLILPHLEQSIGSSRIELQLYGGD